MPSLGLCLEPDRGISLLGDPDKRNRSVDSVDDPLGQSAPFVEDEPEPDTPTAQDLGNSSVPLAAADLLIVPKSEVHVAGRAEAVLQETFGRFEQPERSAFHVECATAPDEPVGEISRERGCVQFVSVPDSTGTTSMCDISKIGSRDGSEPFHR